MSILATFYTLAAVVLANIPDPDPVQPPGTEGFTTVISWIKWIAFTLAAVALIFVAIRMFFRSRAGDGQELVGSLGWIFLGVMIISGGVGFIAMLMGG